jgi:hypothetical protein
MREIGDTQERPLAAKHGLACALSVAVTDETLPELIRLAQDPIHGDSRLLLISALRRSKSPFARQAVETLRRDPVLQKEISSWDGT